MTESEQSEAEQNKAECNESDEPLAFGGSLCAARKNKGLSITQVAKSIHLSEEIIDAIECSAVDRLPQPAFVQGYLRVYARHLGLDEKPILDQYSTAVPHTIEAELHPRSKLPMEADSSSLFVKSISTVLVILLVLAAIYGVFNYYSEMFEATGTDAIDEIDADSILVIPEYEISMQEFSERRMPISDSASVLSLPEETDEEVVSTESEKELPTLKPVVNEVPKKIESSVVEPQAEIQGNDVVELSASEDSWAEVVDAEDVGLFYDLVRQNKTVVLRGTAPFDVFLGNAPAAVLVVNGVQVDMTKFIRSNKIAQFNVSVNDQQVVFH